MENHPTNATDFRDHKAPFARRALLGALASASIAVASAASAQTMFAHPTDTAASQGVQIVGLAILLFTAMTSLGMLVAGVWTTVHRWAEARARRRRSAAVAGHRALVPTPDGGLRC